MTTFPYHLTFAWPEVAILALALALAAAWWERRAGGSRGAQALRGLVVGLIALALGRPALVRGAVEPMLVLADRSASVADGALDAAIAALGLDQPGGDARRMDFGDAVGSPLGAALDRARRALPGGGRIVVLSDGLTTDGGASGGVDASGGIGAVEAAAQAEAAGLRVDTVRLAARDEPDAAIVALDVPAAWRAGEVIPIVVAVRSTAALSATLALRANDRPVRRVAVSLAPGTRSFGFRHPVVDEHEVRFEAVVEADGDAEAGNDRAYAATHIAPPARVLVVGDGPGAVALLDVLRRQGFGATVMAPERLPSRLSQLEGWDALALVDTPAAALGLDQLAALEAFAADLGRGVVLTGGRQSYLPGGWEGTPLADMAPLVLDPPARDERDAVALLLLVDQSASMGSIEGRGRISKLDLAREAALLAADVLHPGDRIGVVTYDDEARWLVPLTVTQAGRALADIEAKIAELATGGGTRILRALELGLPALAAVGDVPTRHAVLLTDGRDVNPDAPEYAAVLASARAAGVTLSTIAIGSDVDRDLLVRLARLGHGRFHSAADPGDLPQLAVEESEIVRARAEQQGAFRAAPAAGGPAPVLSGVDVAALPQITGYLAMRPRPGASIALEAPGGDPLLATWNYGRGRVAAWTSDAGEDWTADWAGSTAATAFWARVVRYVARAPEAGPPGIEIVPLAPDRVRVDVDARDSAGRPIDLAEVSLVMTSTTGAATVALPQTAPGRYGADIALPAPGAYPAAVRVEAEGSRIYSAPAPLAWRYPDELRPGGNGAALLGAVADAGGGVAVDGGAAGGAAVESGSGAKSGTGADGGADAPTSSKVDARATLGLSPAAAERIPLWPWLLALAAGLWVVEVARQTAG